MSVEAIVGTARRSLVRELTSKARQLLRDAAALSDGDLETVRHNLTTAIVATDDVLDAVQSAVEADLREWAITHNEFGKDPE